MKLKKTLSLLIVCAVALSFITACGGDDKPPNGGNGTNGNNGTDNSGRYDPGENPRDLGGLDVAHGIWWPPDTGANTTFGEALRQYREDIQSAHNFTYEQRQVSNYGQMQAVIANDILTNKALSTYVIDTGRFMPLFNMGLLYPVSDVFDFKEKQWNRSLMDAATFDGKVYGFMAGDNPWDKGCMFFNKKVLEEAGIDPDLPYDLQKNNEWTWDALRDICRQVTTNTDYYGFATFSKETLTAAAISNGAMYVGREDNGRFYNASGSNEFLEAAEFLREFVTSGWKHPKPEGSDWNWYVQTFNEGNTAFRVCEEAYKSDLQNVSFDWGMVLFPRGPRMDKLTFGDRSNIWVVPATFDAETVEKIMFAHTLWTSDVPGYDGDEDWKLGARPAYRDTRAVDETLELFRDPSRGHILLHPFIVGLDTGAIADNIWEAEATAQELIEQGRNRWAALIRRMNGEACPECGKTGNDCKCCEVCNKEDCICCEDCNRAPDNCICEVD